MVEFLDIEVTAANAQQLADDLNAAWKAGELSEVNGRKVAQRFTSPVARAWQNGTVSVTIEGRARKVRVNELYIKVGQRLVAWTA